MRITAHNGPGPRGREIIGTDITEAVQVMYDVIHSAGFGGSGWLDADEGRAIIKLAVLMGWQLPDLGGSYGLGPGGVENEMVQLADEFPDHYLITSEERPGYGCGIKQTITKKEL